jgi:hypothetical protein
MMLPQMSKTLAIGGALFLVPVQQPLGHSFPYPASPEFKVEKAVAEFSASRAAAGVAGIPLNVIDAAQSVYASILLWPQGSNGTTLSACFWNGTSDVQKAVIESDKAWDGFSAISVSFSGANGEIRLCSNADSADLRISLDGNDQRLSNDYNDSRPKTGFWSTEGKEAEFTPEGKLPGNRYLVTVNLPSIGMYSNVGDWVDFNDLVRHEMGHARGLLHEHQRAECAGWFDVTKIAASEGWSVEYAKEAVASFDQISQSNDYYRPKYIGGYDILSIMQYNFDKSWYIEKPGETNPCERIAVVSEPSPGDRATLAGMYPLQGGVAAVGSAVGLLNAGSRTEVLLREFEAKVGNERSRIAILLNAKSLANAESQFKGSESAAKIEQKLPPTHVTAESAKTALDRLQQSVKRLLRIELGE